MGNNSGIEGQESVTLLKDSQNWILTDNISSRSHYKNRRTKQQAEQYIFIPTEEINQRQELECYQFRKNTTNPIVNVFLFEKVHNQGIHANGFAYKVLVEFIQPRLNDIGYLSLEEALFLLKQSLKGFQEIYEVYGFLKITEKMIGINVAGMVKVWVTSQLQLNRPTGNERFPPEIYKKFKNNHAAEPTMISNLISLINPHLKQQKFPQDFTNALSKIPSFGKALQHIEEYALRKGFKLPERLIISSENKISLINTPIKKKLSLKQQQTPSNPPVIMLHRRASSKNLNEIQTSSTFKQKIKSINPIPPQVVFDQKVMMPPLPTPVKYSVQNPESKTLSPYVPISNGKTNMIRSNEKSYYVDESNKFETPKYEKIGKNKSYTAFQGMESYPRIPSKSLIETPVKLQNADYLIPTKPQAKEQRLDIESSEIDDITNRIQGIIKGSGIIQNVRSSPQKSNQIAQYSSFSKSLEPELSESPLKKYKERLFNNSNEKKYSYSSFYDQQLNSRSSFNPKQKYYPKVNWDSGQQLSLKRRLEEYRIQGNKNYLP